MSRTGRRELTLGEHFFWTFTAGVAACLMLAVLLYVAA